MGDDGARKLKFQYMSLRVGLMYYTRMSLLQIQYIQLLHLYNLPLQVALKFKPMILS